jgi:UDP-GlcNAc:undecaprenyl-phosphate/decaprenyl-phosphate GlcNAc-1-phosphate transferase
MSVWLTVFVIALVVGFVATRIMIGVAIGDTPDADRKLHTKTTPTSGGVGIMAGCIAAFGYLLTTQDFDSGLSTQTLCLGLALIGGILGLLDDVYVLGAKLKLAFMVLATALFSASFLHIDVLTLAPNFSVPLGPILGTIGTVFWILVLVNTVNFMDGANGLSMGCSAIGLLGLAVLLGSQAGAQTAFLSFIGATACLGFLFWNAGRGAIFAGDAGALFVGLLSAALGAFGVTLGVHPLSVALCFLPLLVDAILTVVWRIKHKENILTPHARHAYQRAIRAGASHSYTAQRYWLQSAFCVFTAWLGNTQGGYQPILYFVILLTGLCILYYRTLRRTSV